MVTDQFVVLESRKCLPNLSEVVSSQRNKIIVILMILETLNQLGHVEGLIPPGLGSDLHAILDNLDGGGEIGGGSSLARLL